MPQIGSDQADPRLPVAIVANDHLSSPRIAWWFQPALFILLPVAMSYTAWAALAIWHTNLYKSGPFEKLAGWPEPSQLSAKGIVLLVVWYATVVAVATLGWRIGSAGHPPNPRVMAMTADPKFEKRYFLLLTAIGAVGIGYAYAKIMASHSIVAALSSQEGNALTKSMSGTAGIETLRYTPILAAPIGIYLWRKKVIGFPMMVVAVVLLLMDALIAHRLGLLMASVVFLTIMVRSAPAAGRRMSRKRLVALLLAVGIVGFSLLGALNYFRNANYYRVIGVENPAAMNLFQMGAYLSVPAQVAIGESGAIMRGTWERDGDPIDSVNAVVPTFLQFTKISKDDSWKGDDVYGYSASFEASFFTNSVFADTYADFGAWGWFYTFPLYGLCGFLLARMIRYNTVIAGSAGVLAYCFSEVWRIEIVSYGFVIYLLLATVGAAVVAAWSLRERKLRATAPPDYEVPRVLATEAG